jgi:carbonic anhydrase/acetyltransferase-like protein (isoleucine patch superfamily)
MASDRLTLGSGPTRPEGKVLAQDTGGGPAQPGVRLARGRETLSELRRRFPRSIVDSYQGLVPQLAERVFLAPGAALAGDVRLGKDVSFWYGAVARGDLAPIIVGERTNIQDGSVMHVGDEVPCIVGAEVVVGHRVMLHACRVDDACLIGMQATILDDCVIGEGSIVGACALVTARTVIPPHSLVLGAPAKVVRTISASLADEHRAMAARYVRTKDNYLRDGEGGELNAG